MTRAAALLAPAGLLIALAAAGSAQAQCETGQSTRFVKVNAVPAALAFPPPSLLDFERGVTAVEQYLVDVHPIAHARNRPWRLCFRADAPAFPSSNGTAKPCSDLEWSTDGAAWSPAASSSLAVTQPHIGRRTVTVLVRVRLDFDADPPGTYGPLALSFWATN